MDTKGLVLRTCTAAAFGLFSLQATAAVVTFEYTESFGAVSPDGPAPWATSVFNDGGSPGSVTLTMSVGSVGLADVTAMYFNLDPGMDVTSLVFTRDSGDGPHRHDSDCGGTVSASSSSRVGPSTGC